MTTSLLAELRRTYHRNLCSTILGVTKKKGKNKIRGYYNNADGGSRASIALADGMATRIGGPFCPSVPSGQAAGSSFAKWTSQFLEESFELLRHLRPGTWTFSTSQGSAGITAYDQYRHLAELDRIASRHPEVRAALGGDYLIVPDIVVARTAVSDTEVDQVRPVIGEDTAIGRLTPFRAANVPKPLPTLHASISCKWTIRSDRSQNTRTEGLNLLRNRKGKSPQMIVVTAEPLPSRIMSIAVGTGDIDCTYHAALLELIDAAEAGGDAHEGHLEELQTMVTGRRLRDISDLPFDLAI